MNRNNNSEHLQYIKDDIYTTKNALISFKPDLSNTVTHEHNTTGRPPETETHVRSKVLQKP